MTSARVVQLVGIGDMGRAFVEHSLGAHPRQVRYCSLEEQGRLGDPSPLAHRMAITSDRTNAGRRRAGSLERQLGAALAGADICLVIGRCDGQFEAVTFQGAVACAADLGCLVVAVPLLPCWDEGFGAWKRAATTMKTSAHCADFLHPFPLSRLELWHELHAPPTLDPSATSPRLIALYESLDPLVAEALRPGSTSLLNDEHWSAGRAQLASLRALPLNTLAEAGSRLPWLGNDALTQLSLIQALDRRDVVLGDAANLSLAAAVEIAEEIDALAGQRGSSQTAISARDDNASEALLFAKGAVPKRLLRLFGNPGPPEATGAAEGAPSWRAVGPAQEPKKRGTAGALASSRSSNRRNESPSLGRDAVLDLGSFELASAASLSISFRLTPDAFGKPTWAPSPWPSPDGSRSPGWPGWPPTTLRRPRQTGPSRSSIREGSVAARLDAWATIIETTAFAAGRWLIALPNAIGRDGYGSQFDRLWQRLRAAPAAERKRGLRAEPLALASAALLLLSPFILAMLGVATLASMSHAVRLSKADTDLVSAFQSLDTARIVSASSEAPITRMPFSRLGLSASARTAMASHLDLLAIKANFFGLDALGDKAPPFQVVDLTDTRAQGRLAMLLQAIEARSDSRAVALNALGFFPSAEKLARLTGSPVSGAAADINTLFQDAEADLDPDDWVAGCGTVLQTLRARFDAKRGAPDDIELPDRYYILYLGLTGTGDCSKRRARAEATYNALRTYSEVSFGRAVIANDALGQPSRVRYSVILPDDIRADIEADEAVKADNPLALYASGMRHFYLLEFSAAERKFGELARQGDDVAAALGAYLAARTSFWEAAFATGGYRPDLYPLSPLFGEEVTSAATSAADDGVALSLSRCRSGENQPKQCIRQVFDRPASGFASTTARSALIAQARAALTRLPIIRPSLLGKYEGSNESVRGEP